MMQSIRTTLVAVGIAAALGGGMWTVRAQGGAKGQNSTEKHPVLQNSIRQLEGIKDRLQRAPIDFGGHREAAIDAINRAMNELKQAIQFDKR